MVAVFWLLWAVYVTYLNQPKYCCRGIQKIVQVESPFKRSYLGKRRQPKALLGGVINAFEKKIVLLSPTEYDWDGKETVHAEITNDWTKDDQGNPVFGKQYAYQMTGFQLHAPIPKDVRGGFASYEDAEEAARREYHDWRSGKIPPGVLVSPQEYWEMHYRSNRYLSHLTDVELVERLKDIMNNFLGLTPDEKISFLSREKTERDWQALQSDVLEESRLRHTGLYTDLIDEWHHPDYDWPGIPKASEAFNSLNIIPGEYLVKYSSLEYLTQTLEEGKIRVSAASTYNDPSLNYAIRDNELQLLLRQRDKPQDQTQLTSPTNYYVYCMSNVFNLRQFGDFKADACLVITKPAEFVERLARAVLRQLPMWTARGRPVNYVDPVQDNVLNADIFWSKNFRYSYQWEYRVVWLPPFPLFTLSAVHVELGNLSDICHLISLT